MPRAIQFAAALFGAALFHGTAHAQADPFPGVTFIPITAEQAREVKRELRNAVLYVDVRSPKAAATSPGIIDAQVPFAEMPLSFENDINAALLSRGLYFTDPVIVIGSDGRQARLVSERLAEIGYSKILVVTDGFDRQPNARTARANP